MTATFLQVLRLLSWPSAASHRTDTKDSLAPTLVRVVVCCQVSAAQAEGSSARERQFCTQQPVHVNWARPIPSRFGLVVEHVAGGTDSCAQVRESAL